MQASAEATDGDEAEYGGLGRPGSMARIGTGVVTPISRANGHARHGAAAPLIETETRHASSFLEAVPEPLIVVDSSGRIARINHKAELVFGLPRHEAISMPIESLLPAQCDDQMRMGRRGNGSTFPVAVSVEDAEVGGNRLQVLLVRDLTEEVERLRRQEEFFANVSHELRAPVTALRASADALLEILSQDRPEDGRRLLANMGRDAERLASLVDDLLDLNSMREGRIHLHLAPCDLRDIAERATHAMEPLAHKHHQTLELVAPSPVPAFVDAQLLGRAVVNLVANACKYGRQGGRIEVHVESHADQAMLTVSDDGPGIPAADRERVFQRFYRSPTPDGRRIQGNGLGLPLCRAVVDMHGGRVWAEETPGGGSTFRIVLPTEEVGALAPRGGASTQ